MATLKESKKVHIMELYRNSANKREAKFTIATSRPPPKARPSMAATDGFLEAGGQGENEWLKKRLWQWKYTELQVQK